MSAWEFCSSGGNFTNPKCAVSHVCPCVSHVCQCVPCVSHPCLFFLAALAALGLPWSLTYLLTVTFIVLDSKPSSPFQPERHVQHWYRPASRDLLSVIIPCASPSDRCRWGSLKDTLVLRSNKFRNVSRRFPL